MSEQVVNPPEELKSVFMYRLWDGQKIRWKFEVDKDMVIVREGPVDPNFARNVPVGLMGRPPIHTGMHIPPHPDPAKIAAAQAQHAEEARTRHKQALTARGIKYKELENGAILIEEVPEKEKQIMQFLDLAATCPDIPGMAMVRDAYKEEYEALGGTACPSCQLNGLHRKYRNILESNIFKK